MSEFTALLLQLQREVLEGYIPKAEDLGKCRAMGFVLEAEVERLREARAAMEQAIDFFGNPLSERDAECDEQMVADFEAALAAAEEGDENSE